MTKFSRDPGYDFTTLVELLRWRARHQPDQRAYTFLVDGELDEGHLTYSELDLRARMIGGRLQELNAAGGRALLLFKPGLDYIGAFFGCLYAGVVAVPVYPPRPNRPMPRFFSILQDAQASVLLTTSSILSMIEGALGLGTAMRPLATDNLPPQLADAWVPPQLSGDALAFLQYTSGSTAAPKGVMLTHGTLLHNLGLIHLAFGITRESLAVIWLPPYHDMGLIGGILEPLYGGFPAILMSPTSFLQGPLRWLQAISRFRATISGGPNFAYDLCVRRVSADQRAGLDLSTWRAAFSGSEPVRHETLAVFAEVFGPCGFRREAFYPCYGLAEGTLFVTGGATEEAPIVKRVQAAELERHRVRDAAPEGEKPRVLIGCGRALGEQRLAIVNPESTLRCAPHEVGEIWVSGPSVARGYWNRPDETQRTFAACIADTREGPFLRTGDLGFLSDGELFVTGRIKDLIIIRGRNHYPQDIELTAERSHPALRPGCGTAFSVDVDNQERLVVVQEVTRECRTPDVNEVAAAIRRAVAEEHEAQVHAVVLIRTGTIPKTSSGKVQRRACRDAYLSGGLDSVGSWREEQGASDGDLEALPTAPGSAGDADLLTWAVAQLAAKLGVPASSIDPRQPIAHHALDSLGAIELSQAIESRLGVGVPIEAILGERSIVDLITELSVGRGTMLAIPSLTTPAAIGANTSPECPLSPGQRALWFLYQLEPGSPAYNVPSAVRILGELEVHALRRAFERLVDRHTSLRTTFSAVDGEPRQEVHEHMELSFVEVDASRWEEAALRAYLVQEANRPFALERGPLMWVHLLMCTPREHVLLLNIHHIITDFWSQAVLLRELNALYVSERDGSSADLLPAIPYADFAREQNQTLVGQEGERLWKYWEKRLTGAPAALSLHTDRPRPPVQSYRGAAVPITLDGELLARLKNISQRQGATLFMTLLAAFDVLLWRHTGQDDILVGSPSAGRTRARWSELVGYCVNAIVLRAHLGGDPQFTALLQNVRSTVLGALEHQDYPFATLVERLHPQRDPSRSALFQVMLALQKVRDLDGQSLSPFAAGEDGAQIQWGGLTIEWIALDQQIAQFDLTLNLGEAHGRLVGTLNYNSDLFAAETAARMVGHFRNLLEAIAADPDCRISALPLLGDEESRLLMEWNRTQAGYPRDACIHDLIAAQVGRTPDAACIVHGGRGLTYAELDQGAARLAQHLVSLGAAPEGLVGILLESSSELVVAVVSVLKCGAGYLPLDPTFPPERLAFMLRDAGARIVLTREQHRSLLPPDVSVVSLDADAPRIPGRAAEAAAARPDSVACAIYTSGSTGQPKGVLLTHRNLVNLVSSFIRSYDATGKDKLVPLTSVSTASFVGEILPLLCVGGTVVLPDREQTLNFLQLAGLLRSEGVSIVSTVPSVIRLLNSMKDELRSLRLLLSGGEALVAADVDKLLQSTTIVNGYGLTETSVCSTYRILDESDTRSPGALSIGKPVHNHQVYILDDHLRCVPIGSPGELCIAGDGLARGYLNNPSLTAERFVPNPFGSGERMYRTGDLAAWSPDGSIEYLGRIDRQVKIRGFRLDVEEIEAVLDSHPAVTESAVVALQETATDKRLVAYVSSQDLTAGDLLTFTREKLPDYMVPSAFVMLAALPHTASGKIDRLNLPAPEAVRPDLATSYVAPRSELERSISKIWQEALGIEKAGIHDNFFDLGGHSLLMTKVHSQLCAALGRKLSLIDLFKYPTVSALTRYLSPSEPAAGNASEVIVPRARTQGESNEIAIIGMTGRFPGARSVEELWENLRRGVEAITFFTDAELEAVGVSRALLSNPDYIKAKGVLGYTDLFDAHFFGLNPREVELMDPQHRLFLECAWEALERAGYDPWRYKGRVGVYAGESMNTYLIMNLLPHLELVQSVDTLQASLGNDKDPLTSRVSYKLDLKGPSITIQSASSTSLVAVHVACQSLLNDECDMALAGGVSVHLPERSGYMHQQGGTTSRDGHCRAFDAKADGFVPGNGLGVVVLKRLAAAQAHGDNILAIIKGSACNNDGSEKVSFMAPSVEGQVTLYRRAHALAGVSPDTITYIECHGTGTALGDPIEAEALIQAFRTATPRTAFCALGSLKTNIGHLDAAAGVCGLIKTVLMLQHKMIPACLHYEDPNPQIDFASSPFFVNTALREWQTEAMPRRAAVTSLGMGGTNAHVVLEEAPAPPPPAESRTSHLLVLSARSSVALEAQGAQLLAFLKGDPEASLADIAHTLQVGRRRFAHRAMLLCTTLADAVDTLQTQDSERLYTAYQEPGDRSVVFMFTGQGAQHVNMALDLYRGEGVFRAEVDRCAELLQPQIGTDIRSVIHPAGPPKEDATDHLKQTALAQPALFTIEYALAKLWMKWGIRPQAMIGHSIGEYVAACLAGVFSVEEALTLVSARGRLMQQVPSGAMLAVPLPEAEVRSFLGPALSLATINHPGLCVMAGPNEAVQGIEQDLLEKGVACRRLHTSHAFHSYMMDPILPAFLDQVRKVKLNTPRLPYLSNVSGTWIRPDEATDPSYWVKQLRQTVRFADGLGELLKDPDRILLEVGPGNTLSALARQHPGRIPSHVTLSSLPHPQEKHSDATHLMTTLGRLWLAGAEVDWNALHEGRQRRRVCLPTYPFERRRYWVDPGKPMKPASRVLGDRRPFDDWFYVPIWKGSRLPASRGTKRTGEGMAPCLVFADDTGLAAQLTERLRGEGHSVTIVEIGKDFERKGPDHYSIRPEHAHDYTTLLQTLPQAPRTIVHMWNVTSSHRSRSNCASLSSNLYSLLFLAQATGKLGVASPIDLWVVSNHLQEVTGEEVVHPEKATLLGACRVLPREYPHLTCRCLDMVSPRSGNGAMADHLAAELKCQMPDPVVAWCGNSRWVQVYEPTTFDEPAVQNWRLREGGTYLILGGLGGIGLKLADFLARQCHARLVLVGRSRMPARGEWPTWIATHDTNDSTSRRIQSLRDLEAHGAEVLALSADVTNQEEMEAVRQQACARFGAVHGIIHAAGVPGGGLTQTRTAEEIAAVLAPKVHGTLVLESVFKHDALDFIVLCSSTTALLGHVGQVDYAAANAFLDAFAHHHSMHSAVPTISINWDAWQEVGMAVNTPVPAELREWREAELRKGILPAEGVDAFARILHGPHPQVIVCTQDLNELLQQRGALVSLEEPAAAQELHPRPVLPNAYVAPSGETERVIANIWREALGIEQVGTRDNFFDLGGNSLIAIRIMARIKSELRVDLPDVSLFEAPTIASLARIVEPGQDALPALEAGRSRGEKRRARTLRKRELHKE